MNTASPFVALPERFNCLESMLFAPRPAEIRHAAERYAGELLSRPAPAPRVAPTMPELVVSEPALSEPGSERYWADTLEP